MFCYRCLRLIGISCIIFFLCPSYTHQKILNFLGELAEGLCSQQKLYASTRVLQKMLEEPEVVAQPKCETYKLNTRCKGSSCKRVAKHNCSSTAPPPSKSQAGGFKVRTLGANNPSLDKVPGSEDVNITVVAENENISSDSELPSSGHQSSSSSTNPDPPGNNNADPGGTADDESQHKKYLGLVSIQQVDPGHPSGYVHFCAGTILKKTWVVSAAHCFCDGAGKQRIDASKLQVVAKAYDLLKPSGKEQAVRVKKVICHLEFSKHTFRNYDIALLEVDPPFMCNRTLQAVHLPEDTLRSNGPFVSIGWGSQHFSPGPISPAVPSSPATIKETELKFYQDDQCATKYQGRADIEGVVWDHQLCTYDTSADYNFIVGDSGGPLYLKESNKETFTLAGIASFGDKNKPTVFTEIAFFIDWIKMNAKVHCVKK